MQIKYFVFLFSISLGVDQAPSRIVETKKFEDLLNYVDKDSLVIIDLDRTVVLLNGNLTQQNIPEIINQVKDIADKTISITARPPASCLYSYNQMAKFGIKFDNMPLSNNSFTCFFGLLSCKHYKGIVSIGWFASKGKALFKILNLSGYKLKKIVIIDDKIKNITDIQNAAKDLNVPFVGLWYTKYA